MIYWHLPYKKKFIWNLIQIPFVLVLIIWCLLSDDLSPFLTILLNTALVTVTITTLFYTYSKWKKEEAKNYG